VLRDRPGRICKICGEIEAQIATLTLLDGASRLVSKIGAARAKELVFSADIYDAKTLLALRPEH
jgi:hypothetical protein